MRELLWEPAPARQAQANMTEFMSYVNNRCGTTFSTYDQLYNWSINNIPDFWRAMWDFASIRASQPFD
ncbi:MAG TPA: acetoacetate--CoA ligase, partial [Verrucomicrobiae bacterium]|nr:acetoacetate--CoA ligase [Verrucomicrobiae bacterium]